MGFSIKRAASRVALLRALVLGGAAMSGMNATDALAQTATPAPAPEATDENEIIVVGSRPLAESEAASLIIQRNSDNLVSVLSADGIGRLPDQNIAFAIGRLPGVGLERDQGQARYVNLRGAPRYWTTISFDGLSVVSPEGRDSRFDNIPSAIAKQVIVNKAITPDLPGGTVAGNVDVITRTAFDYEKEGFNAFGNLGLGYVELGGGEEVDTSLVVSDVFFNGGLGVLMQGSFYRRNMVTDNWETDPYLRPGASGTPANAALRFAREYENKPYRLTRENSSFSARVDVRPDDMNTLFANVIWTQYADEELRNNYIFRLDQGLGPTGTATGPAANPINTPTQGIVYAANLTVNTNSLESQEDSYIGTLGGEHELAGWTLDWRANYTYTKDGRDAPALPNFAAPTDPAQRPTVVYDFRNGDRNTVALYRTIVTGTGASAVRSQGAAVASVDDFSWPFLNITKRIGSDDTQAYTFKFDAEREFEMLGAPVEFKTGLLWTDRTKKSNEVSWTANAAAFTSRGLPLPTYAQFRNGKRYQGDLPLGYTFTYHSKDALDRFMAGLIQQGIATKNDTSGNFWKVGEQLTAGYAMAKVTQDWGNIVFGVRGEQQTITGRAIGAGGNLIRTTSEDTLFFPSAHANIDLSEELKLRVGVTTSASRPDFDDMRPNLTFNDAARTVSGGNPFAEPEQQTGIDVYLEHYGENGGFASAGFFYKDVSNVLFTQAGTFNSTVLNGISPATDRSGYTLTTLRNGGSGYLVGGEVFFSQTAENLIARLEWPEWLGGFGLRGSATFTSSEVVVPAVGAAPDRRISLPGTSDSVYNLQLTYEMYGLSARLAYQVRSPWRQNVGNYTLVGGVLTPDGNGDVFWDEDDELDLSLRYRLNDNFEVYADGVNLLDGPGRRFADTTDKPIEFEKFGRRYLVGVRFNF